MDVQKKLLLVGACSSIRGFARNFTKSSPKVIAMEREKMALKDVGDFTLVRTNLLFRYFDVWNL